MVFFWLAPLDKNATHQVPSSLEWVNFKQLNFTLGTLKNVPAPYPWNANHALPTQDSVKGRFSKPLYVEEEFLLDPVDDMKHAYAFLNGRVNLKQLNFALGTLKNVPAFNPREIGIGEN